MTSDSLYLNTTLLTASVLQIGIFEEVKSHILSHLIISCIASLLIIVVLALYRKVFKETFQDFIEKKIGAKSEKTIHELENDLLEASKSIENLKERTKKEL